MDIFSSLWPPSYTVKKHSKARHVKLKASLKHGLELIIPPRFNQKNIPAILEENRSWIEKQLLKLRRQSESQVFDELPEKIELLAIQETWKIDYIPSNTRLSLVSRPHQELALFGNIQNKEACKKILTLWAKKQAKLHLPIQLENISQQINIPYQKTSIRDQQTRWGSCSREKAINLNYKLLFLPPEFAAHIMIHELCHTVHLNHSEKFWALVAKHDANWNEHRRMLRQADKFIPGWII